ncbi:MAG: ParB/RepB/Spo0J family partition protein [Nitrososphaerales archaeon]
MESRSSGGEMGISADDDQLKAKIGQILYNNYITDRLREEVLQRVAHRNSLALRMSIGKDSTGEEVYLDILVNRVRPEVEELKRSVRPEQTKGEDLKKYTCIILSSDSMQSADNSSISTNFEYLMSQSLSWWARYSGSRDTLNVDKWKIEHALTIDGKRAYFAADIPLDSIIVPDSRKYDIGDISKLSQNLESQAPVLVRLKENGRFELIQGYHVLQAYSRSGRREIPAIIKSVTDEEADKMFEEGRKSFEKVPVRNR